MYNEFLYSVLVFMLVFTGVYYLFMHVLAHVWYSKTKEKIAGFCIALIVALVAFYFSRAIIPVIANITGMIFVIIIIAFFIIIILQFAGYGLEDIIKVIRPDDRNGEN